MKYKKGDKVIARVAKKYYILRIKAENTFRSLTAYNPCYYTEDNMFVYHKEIIGYYNELTKELYF